MLLFSLMLVALEDPAAVKQDAKCAAVMLAARDSFSDGEKDERAAASAAAAYARNAVTDADRKMKGLDQAQVLAAGRACFEVYDRTLARL